MKKYRVNVVGTKYVTTETEDKAIEHTQDMLDHIHKSLNMQVFSICLLYTSPSPRDLSTSRMPSSA